MKIEAQDGDQKVTVTRFSPLSAALEWGLAIVLFAGLLIVLGMPLLALAIHGWEKLNK